MLAWLWVASLLGTVVDLLALSGESPLEFSSAFLGWVMHWLVWLLVWPAASYWGWTRELPRLLWRGLLLLIPIGCLSLLLGPLGVLLATPVFYVAEFFLGAGRWQTKYIYFQRDHDLMVLQESSPLIGGSHRRGVQLIRVGPLLQLVEPLPDNQPAQATGKTLGYAG
jgi:hypothetical protein